MNKPNKKKLMASYQLPGDMAEAVLFLCPKKGMPGYEYGGYAEFMQESVQLKLLCRDLHISHEEAIRRINGRADVNPPAKAKSKKAPTKRFVPPTVEEVADFCRERGNNVDANSFVAHYQTNGWTRGKQSTPIKDWKACVRTWEGKSNSFQSGVTADKFATPDRSALFAKHKEVSEINQSSLLIEGKHYD